jgi:DNA repair protein RecO (recombination protein O)
MIKQVEGIVVSEVDYKESSKIINVLTNDSNLIGIIARGSKKVNSKISGVGKLTYANFQINYRDKLSTLIEYDIINGFKNIKSDIVKVSYAMFITELSYKVFEHSNNSNIYDLYRNSLLKIDEGFEPLVITNILELKLLEYLGIKPMVDACVSCGKTDNIVTISSYKGGYLCKDCLENEGIVTDKAIKLIRMFYYVDIAKITKLEISDNVKKEINNFIDDYYDRYSGIYLKSKSFIDTLDKIS